LRADRQAASRAVARFDDFSEHLRRLGLLTGSLEVRRLGGWLKMGMVGTVAARGNVLLVGDAAGLVNPLQGEGIAPAMASGAAAAEAVLAGPCGAAVRYRQVLASGPGRYARATAPLHAAVISGSPRRVSRVARVITARGVGAAIASPWAVLWNDLIDGSPPGSATLAARTAAMIGRVTGSFTAVRRQLDADLDGS